MSHPRTIIGHMPTPTELVTFEREHSHTRGREELIRHTFGITPVRYTQLLIRAVRSIEGIAADPVTCRRVRERVERKRNAPTDGRPVGA